MLKKLALLLSLIAYASPALAAFSQPIFQVRGTALKPYYSAGSSVYTTGKPGSGASDTAVTSLATTGVFGSSVLDFTSSSVTNARFLRYAATGGNVPSTSAMSWLWRIVPLWTGNPSTIQTLVLAGDTDAAVNDVVVNITTLGKLKIEIMTKTGADAVILSSVNSLSFTNGTPTDIMFTWDGTTTTGAVKIYQEGALVEADTANATVGVWDQNQVLQFELGKDSFDNNLARNNLYYLNEFDVFDSVQPAYSPRTGFITSLNQNGDHNTDPGAANVLNTAGTYYINGAPITPTLAAPSASDVKHGVVVSGVTGTYRGYDLWQAVAANHLYNGDVKLQDGASVTGTDQGFDFNDAITASVLKVGQHIANHGVFVDGTYDGSDRWSDPGAGNVVAGIAYQANSVTNNQTGTLSSTDPGVGNVLSGVTYAINSVGKVGTYSSTATDPGIANVKIGTTYLFNSSLLTGTYDGSDRWSDPLAVNVSSGVTYKANNVLQTGTRNVVQNVIQNLVLVAQPGAGVNSSALARVTQGDTTVLNLLAQLGGGQAYDLTGATLTTQIKGPTGTITLPNSAHAINPDQTNCKGCYMLTVDTTLLRAAAKQDIVTTANQGGTILTFHGNGILTVLPAYPEN